MINNYIFDFGCVLAEFNPEKFTKAYIKEAENVEIVKNVVFDRLYWNPLDAGTITDDEVKKQICNRLPDSLQETACKIYDSWIELLTPIEGMENLVKSIKNKGGRLYLLSNISIGFANSYDKVPWIKNLFSLFDGLVFSGPIGITKPNTEIFFHLLEKYNLKAEESIFIDDSKVNISGGEKAGIKGYFFDGDAQKLAESLEILK